jgi:hypothetical protein
MSARAHGYNGCGAGRHSRLKELRRLETHVPGLRGPDYDAAFVLGRDGKKSYVGARNSPRSQPLVSRDFIGSTSSTTV